MLVVDIVAWESKTSSETKVICRLGWDERKNRIKILKGIKVGKRILKEKFLDKRWHWSEKAVYLSADQGEDFIQNLCYGLAGSRVWALKAYEGIEE